MPTVPSSPAFQRRILHTRHVAAVSDLVHALRRGQRPKIDILVGVSGWATGCNDHGRAVEDAGDARTQRERPTRDDAQGLRPDAKPPPARRVLRADQAESVGRQQGEALSFTQVPGCDDKEVAAVEGGDLADIEPFGEGDHAGVHHLQSQ